MCNICKKFKRGSITREEALDELDEQADYLTEDHIEDIEEMLSDGEDAYDYISERKNNSSIIDEDEYYEDDEDDLPDYDDDYDLDEGDE